MGSHFRWCKAPSNHRGSDRNLGEGLATDAGGPYSFSNALKVTVVNHFHTNLLVYAAIVLAWHALNYYREGREREIQAAALAAQLAQAQVADAQDAASTAFLVQYPQQHLRVESRRPEAANRMIARLSELLRLSLENDGAQEVSLPRNWISSNATWRFNRCGSATAQRAL
jgi:hypothetical protein